MRPLAPVMATTRGNCRRSWITEGSFTSILHTSRHSLGSGKRVYLYYLIVIVLIKKRLPRAGEWSEL